MHLHRCGSKLQAKSQSSDFMPASVFIPISTSRDLGFLWTYSVSSVEPQVDLEPREAF